MSKPHLRHFAFSIALSLVLVGALPASAAAATPSSRPSPPAHDAMRPKVMAEAAAKAAAAPGRALAPFSPAPSLRPRPGHGGAAGARAGREVFGFVNAGNIASGQVGYPSWNLSLLSTIAFFGLHVSPGDGSLVTNDTGWAEWNSADLTNLLTAAHGSGVQVVVTVILQDYGQGMCSGLAHADTTVAQVVAQVQAKGVDGVNVDYEGTNESCGGTSSRALLTGFVQRLRGALPDRYLSVDTYASSAADSGGFFDVPGLARSADSLFVMAYDMDGNYSWGNWAYPPLGCASYCFSPGAPLTAYRYNDTAVAAQYTSVVPASQVILGVPYYGYTACVAPLGAGRPGPNAAAYPAASAHWTAPSYLDAISNSSYPGVGNYAAGRDALDGAGQEPFATWTSSTYDCWRESYWEDAVSLGRKYDLVNSDNLRGVGIFTLDYGGGAPELWAELAAKFSEPSNFNPLGGTLTSAPAAAAWGPGREDVFVRGTDNGLWHRWWNGGGAWGGWEPLGGLLTSNPAVTSWGANRLDVFARSGDGALWHRWWDGSAWGGWEPLGGLLASDPVVVSPAANRLDVLVRGTDDGLWRRSWNGTRWTGWEGLGGVLRSDPLVVSWAANRLDVFVRGTDDAAWHKTWDGTTWRSWESLGGTLVSRPAGASWGAGRLDLFVRGTDGGLWHRWWDGSKWLGWESLAGQLTSLPAVASAAAGRLDVVVKGTDNGLWRRSWTGTGWTWWAPLGGQWQGDPVLLARTGALDLFAVGPGSGLWQTTLT